MTVQYVGPRPVISHHGIDFKDGKEDKYVYLKVGVEILEAIDKDYDEKSSYRSDIENKEHSDDEILEIMKSYESDLHDNTIKEIAGFKEHLDMEVEQVNQRAYLKDVEKKVWINNLEIMKEYRIQRAVNKIYYMHCINNIKTVINRERIKEIDTPFSERYWHVLQTLQGSLEGGKYPVRTNLRVEPENDQMVAKLTIDF
jgi:hypothetical protein